MLWTGSNQDAKLVQLFYVLVAVFLAVTAVIAMLSICIDRPGGFVKDWRYIMNAYLDAQASVTGDRGVPSQVIQAKNPRYLTAEMGYTTFGEGAHFAVDIVPGVVVDEIITQVVSLSEVNMGKRQLPYPPYSLWCVNLNYVDKPDGVILVAYHIDMYSAEWVVHIADVSPFSKGFLNLTSQLGCELKSISD
jgi:hypothetical protein